MSHQPAALLSTGTVLVLGATALCVALTLVAVLALISTLAREKTRRNAAYKVLKLLIDVILRDSARRAKK